MDVVGGARIFGWAVSRCILESGGSGRLRLSPEHGEVEARDSQPTFAMGANAWCRTRHGEGTARKLSDFLNFMNLWLGKVRP